MNCAEFDHIDLEFQNGEDVVNPTECFLKFLELPEDETLDLDLRQCAVVLMCYLDRLSLPYMPSSRTNRVGTGYSVGYHYS